MRARTDYVILQLLPPPPRPSLITLLPENDHDRELSRGRIISLGPQCKDLVADEIALWPTRKTFDEFEFDEHAYCVVKADELLALEA